MATHLTSSGIAERLQHVESSPTLALAAKAKALAKAGKPIVDLTAGEPDFPTPEPVKQAGIQAIQKNQTRYTPVAGVPELRAAIATTLTQQLGVAYQPSQVLVSCGAKHSLYNIFQALCNPGDEVVIFAPYWVSYPPMVYLAGGTPKIISTDEANGFLPEPDALRRALTPKTKIVVLNSPSNPTGAVIDRGRLKAIAAIALERDLILISDEIYDRLVYPPATHVSIVTAEPRVADRTVVVNGVSKTYSMTGWRIGYAAGPQPWIDAMSDIQSHSTSNPTSISQLAALAALTGGQEAVAEMRTAFVQRRDRLVAGLNRLHGLRCAVPGGAFYAWCNVSALGASSETIAARWLDEAHLAVVPGEGFGAPGYMRFSFATSLEHIDQALRRLEKWIGQR
ncbi:MAG: aspartate aminotransferase [Candidatus Omnitrophica bacterium CG11_big_fil_rev_8_21_14_0_20_63_9]|nr:MAG: aspartate aminotransferase [Candidatus Omnitrophica bacterium CG11_big_fil_rev_8_21_14_0_20_63_9]